MILANKLSTRTQQQPLEFIGYATGASGTTDWDVTVDVSSLSAGTLQADDLILIVSATGQSTALGNAVYTAPTDFDMLINGDLYNFNTYPINMGVAKKIATGSETTLTFNSNGTGGSSGDTRGIALVFRGVDTTTPLGTPFPKSNDDDVPPNGGAVTDVAPTSFVIVFGATATNSNASNFTGPAGYEAIINNRGPLDTSLGVTWNETPSSTENPGAFTGGGVQTGSASVALTVEIKEA